MAMNQHILRLALGLLLTMAACITPAIASTAPQTAPTGGTPAPVSCMDLGYQGMQLAWCREICEKGNTGAALKVWIRRWIDRYHTLPACAPK